MDQYLKGNLEAPINKTYVWAGSTIILHYIKNTDRRFQTFVANRVSKIHQQSDAIQWRHNGTDSNPADDVSRDMNAKELLGSVRWVSGPEFFKGLEESWPVQQDLGGLPDDVEVKRTKELYVTSHILADALEHFKLRYFDWHRLKRAVPILLCLKALLRILPGPRLVEPITLNELLQAETDLLKYVQTSLKVKQVAKLKPFTDQSGILRVGGRLTHTPIPYETKHPIILPSNHHITLLIINYYHSRLGHVGQERVLAEVRQKFWILKGRASNGRILSSCQKCRRQKAKPQIQQTADLPESRVSTGELPFTRVGVFCFGPFYVKRARSQVKCYGCVFTCLAIRAVHLGVFHLLDTSSFINALQRFIARRGSPSEIRSDNGTNFVGARHEIYKASSEWNQDKIVDHLLQPTPDGSLTPPAASHMGGVSIYLYIYLSHSLGDRWGTTRSGN